MKLIIDIPEDVYNDMIELVKVDGDIDRLVDVAIVNGTPLTESDDCVSRKEALHSICKNCEWYQGFKPTCINKCGSYKRIMKLPSVQPKVVECDDCVSREAVIKLVKKGEYDITGETDNEMFLEEVNKLPSVQPKRDKGEWYIYQDYWYECSKCGCLRYMPTFTENYCPNCGADMRTESEDKK